MFKSLFYILKYFSDDFEEIKQDISSFRYEMLNYLSMRESDHRESSATIFSIANQMIRLREDMDTLLEKANTKPKNVNIPRRERKSNSFPLSANEKQETGNAVAAPLESIRNEQCTVLPEENEDGN